MSHHLDPHPPLSQSVAGDTVVGALAKLEIERTGPPIAGEAVAGSWELVFAAPGPRPLGADWRYIPVAESFDIGGVSAGSPVALRSAVGPVRFAFSGGVAGWTVDAATLSFAFTRVAVSLGGGSPFYEKDLGERPARTYTFFAESVRRERERGRERGRGKRGRTRSPRPAP